MHTSANGKEINMDLFDRYDHFDVQLFDMDFNIMLSKNLLKALKLKQVPSRHMHKSWELYYIRKGFIEVDLEDGCQTYNEGTFTLIPPNTEHCIIRASEDIDHKSIRFTFKTGQSDMSKATERTLYSHALKENKCSEDIAEAFEQLKAAYKIYVNGNTTVWIEQKVAIFCMLFVLNIIESISGKTAWKKKSTSDDDNLNLIIEFFTEQKEDVSVAALAKALNYSVSQTNRLLKSKFGMSFRELHNEVRVRKSKYYLTKTTLPVEEISNIIGFNRKKYFDSFFKSIVGVTPMQYRRKNQASSLPSSHS